jgi:hypothetical protein
MKSNSNIEEANQRAGELLAHSPGGVRSLRFENGEDRDPSQFEADCEFRA